MLNKKIVVLILIALLCVMQARAEQLKVTDVSELSFKELNNIENAYLKDGKPFTGAVTIQDSEGRDITYVYREGRKNGPAIAYYENGKPELETSYARGMKNGDEVFYYINGNPKRKSSYQNNVLHGEEIFFYENGKPQKRLYYKEGKLNDVLIEFDVNGNKTKITPYVDDVINGVEQLFERGALHRRTYKDGVLDGEDVLYYDDGKKTKVFKTYKNGKLEGKVAYFDINGKQTKIENYENDVKQGLEQVIVNNSVREEYNYVDGKLDGLVRFSDGTRLTEEIHYKNGKKEGAHTVYNADGSRTIVNYVNDQKSGEAQAFYPSGQIANKGRYLFDKKNGIMEKYYDTGILSSSESYKDDQKDGISRYFDAKGYLVSVGYFEKGVELSKVDVAAHKDLNNIYEAYKKGQLSRFSDKRNFWYLILWLSLNTNDKNILEALKNEMEMYGISVGDLEMYKRYAVAKYPEYAKNLFFGLTPLSYALDIASPSEVLHEFSELVNVPNSKGTTALQEAVYGNNIDGVKYLLLNKADISSKDSPNRNILLYALKNNTQNDIIDELLKAGAPSNITDEQANTPLSLAIKQHNVDLFNVLAQNGANLDGLTDSGQTMLFYAYENKAPANIIEHLLKDGVDVNKKDNLGNVLLVNALTAQDYDMVELLIKYGADVNEVNGKKESAITYALANSVNQDTEKLIFSQKLNLKDSLTKLHKTLWRVLIEKDRLDLLKMIYDKAPTSLFEKDEAEEVPFYEALKIKDNHELRKLVLSYVDKADNQMIWTAMNTADLELLKFMVAHKADVNAVNEEGDTLLIYAVKHNMNTDFMQALETPELDINKTTSKGENALDVAVFGNNVTAAENLLEHGADINRKVNGKTYLMQLKNYQSEMTQLLIERNANLKIAADDGTTLLMNAVINLNSTLVDLLAEHDVDFNARDNDGNTALLYLTKSIAVYPNMSTEDLAASFRKVITLLMKGGADINVQDYGGNTLLMKLAQMKTPAYTVIRDVMVELGASTEMKDQYGKTAADYE